LRGSTWSSWSTPESNSRPQAGSVGVC
jgi:hypothetical protein